MATSEETCNRHEREIKELWDHTNDLSSEVGKREVSIVTLERDLVALRESIPKDLGSTIARMDEKMTGLQTSVADIVEALKRGYVTVAEFDPVKRLVYGLVGLILVSVVGAVLALVLRNHV